MAESYEITKRQLYLLVAIALFLAILFLVLGFTAALNFTGVDFSGIRGANPPVQTDVESMTPVPAGGAGPSDAKSFVPDGSGDTGIESGAQVGFLPTQDPSPPETIRSGTGYTIQITSVGIRGNAIRLQKDLQTRGYPAYLSIVEYTNGKVNYRIRVGPYADRAEAEIIKMRLEKELKSTLLILQVDMSRENR
ncbi:SPOR domain-containing protein [bacterium]|nr:SPOR domain-containing protein [candidate division CSSED10-310 bacterium]